ncbi:MAG: metalloprotease TldD, partial [Gammaproteobacteria bacterium]|nr:metalloprotease TldD [Gammaproteobacteria bacterium]
MSTPSLVTAREALLSPYGLGENDLQTVLDQLMGHSIDNADLYFQISRHESWMLEDGIVREGHHGIEQGVGVRAVSGEKTGFAYSDEIMLPALTEAADAARAIARSGRQGTVQAWQQRTGQRLYLPVDPLSSLGAEQKISLLRELDAEARRLDPRVKQVVVSLAGSHEVVLVAASDGTLAADVRPLVRMYVSVV